MTISDLIALAIARLANLTAQRTSAVTLGDVVRIAQLDTEITETEATLAALRGI
jgi:hypothetical protein